MQLRKRYLKLFLHMAVPFGFLIGIFYALTQGIYLGVVIGVLLGVLYGVVTTLVLGYLHVSSAKKSVLEDDYSRAVHEVNQQERLELSVPYEKAFNLCLEASEVLHRVKIENYDYAEGIIQAKTGVNWDTFGDLISFKLIASDDNYTDIEITSKPKVYQLLDYGKNYRNVKNIRSYLEG